MESTVNCTRIDLPFLSTTKRTVVSVKESYLLLYDTYLQYKMVADYTFEDEDTGIPVTTESNYRWTRLKRDLCDVDMYRDRIEEKFAMDIFFRGTDRDPGWYFDNPKAALTFYNQMVQYFVG